MITADADNWLEIGSGHQCGDGYRYWFWGLGYRGVSIHMGNGPGLQPSSRTPSVSGRREATPFSFTIDGVLRATQVSSVGQYIETGLETYAPAAVIGGYAHSDLRYALNGGAWVSWSGQDSSSVGLGMCDHTTGGAGRQ
jgi:hypothetical protein